MTPIRRRPPAIARAAGLALLLGWACVVAEIHPAMLVDPKNVAATLGFARGMFPPDLSPGFLREVALAVARTLAIAVAGSALAVLFGLPLGVLATPSLFRRGILLAAEPAGVRSSARALASVAAGWLLRFLRAVPDLMWGIVFVVAVGLGPLAGTLAVGVAYAGVLGRVYADVFESVDPGPLEALHATGAGRLAVFVTAVWPQATKNVIAYTFYAFECCVRAASVLGFIGAGGMAYEINVSMRLFDYQQVLTLICAYLAVVFASEAAGRALRRRLGPGIAGPRWPRARRLALAAGIAGAVLASFLEVGLFTADLRGAGGRALRFAGSLWPPDLSYAFLRSLPAPVLQTIAIALVGTTMGVVLGAALTLPAAVDLAGREGQRGAGRTMIRALAVGASRGALALFRSIPELLWVLLCIVAIGLGPFPGTLAVGLHTAGVLGKLYSDALEETPPGPIEALRATGATGWALLIWGVLPQAWPTLTSYTLLRFEANLRAATVVGLVGGGGIGLVLYNDIQLGFYDRVGTLVVLVYGMITASDWLTDRIRRRTLSGAVERPADTPDLALLATRPVSTTLARTKAKS
ncbi:MAG: ABC transporter permease subunit [Minicystis sp.]